MKSNLFKKAAGLARAHKFISSLIVIVIVGGAYYWYHSATSVNAAPQYVLSSVHNGSIIQTVSGTGQVSASNQTDILSQVSGTIQSIDVSVGQAVHTGDLIATIDSSNAAITLANSKISYAKLTEPAKATDISNSKGSLAKAYNDGFNAASNIYLDLPSIMSNLKDLLYSQSGFLSDQNSSYLSSSARVMRETAGKEYDAAVSQYQTSLNEFKVLARTSATSSLDTLFADTYTTIQMVAKAVTDAQNAVTFITTTQPDYQPKTASTVATNVNSWTSQANSDLTSLSSAQNSIVSATNAYTTLINGADQYDIEAARLSLEQQQKTYSNYFIRAPYDGIIGRIPVNVYGQAGNGTVIATIVGSSMTASISLDEVNAAKVKVGQSAKITFNAISDLNATGTVSVVDQIGTVTQGVISYGVKIAINTQDDRIKPGMSVNTSIITYEKDGVLIVPTSAIKTQAGAGGGTSFVQVFDRSVLGTTTASSSRFASSTFASSTRQFGGYNAQGGQGRSITLSTKSLPQQTTVVTGDSDDTNTEIVSGLTRGQLVVTKTIASGGTTSTTAAPSILSSLTSGARGGAGGGATRITGGSARPGGN